VKIERFSDLTVWQEGHKLALHVYRLTEKFPSRAIWDRCAGETLGCFGLCQYRWGFWTANDARAFEIAADRPGRGGRNALLLDSRPRLRPFRQRGFWSGHCRVWRRREVNKCFGAIVEEQIAIVEAGGEKH